MKITFSKCSSGRWLESLRGELQGFCVPYLFYDLLQYTLSYCRPITDAVSPVLYRLASIICLCRGGHSAVAWPDAHVEPSTL